MTIFKNLGLKIFTLWALFMVFFSAGMPLFAFSQELAINNIGVYDIQNGSATVRWTTPGVKTSGILYVGENENTFDRTFKYTNYSYTHEITVKNLEKNKTYFYKIIAADQQGNRQEIFVRSFSTSQMTDTRKPVISGLKVTSSNYGAIALQWTTSEETSSLIEYGTDSAKLNKNSRITAFSIDHEAILYNLESGKKYYIKVIAQDHDGNTDTESISATPSGSKSQVQLLISDVYPAYADSSAISARGVHISFRTNLPAKSRIRYGTNAKMLTKYADVSLSLSTNHSVEIGNLTPRTTYYYKIEAYDSLYGAKTATDILSFETGNVSVRFPSGSLVRAVGDTKVYIIYEDTKAWIESPAVFLGLGFKGDWVQEVTSDALNDYQEVKSVSNSQKHPSGTLIKYNNSQTIYFIGDNVKRPISSPEAFVRNGFKWGRVVPASKWEYYLTGDYIV